MAAHGEKNQKRRCPPDEAQGDRNPKRPRADEHPRETNKVRPTDDDHNLTPSFWDNLSKISLTRRALRELDRRNDARSCPRLARPDPAQLADDICPRRLARFARNGGPGINDLRGYPAPGTAARTQASSHSSGSSSQRTRSVVNTTATSVSTKSRKSSAYDKLFETHLIDHSVYPEGYDHPDGRPTPEPDNLDDTRPLLSAHRSSLSPSQFPDSAFRSFKEKNRRAVLEQDVMNSVVPMICGDADIPNQQNVLFTELDVLTTDDLVRPRPDFFDGARSRDVHKRVKDMDDDQNIRSSIIPTKHPNVPVAPNLFLEAKGPDGSAAVVRRQACYDGAYGARAMHRLQNYGREEAAYDGNAYTFSSTYHDGQLKLYAHHITAPEALGGQPEYHMTQLDSWGMTGNINTFRSGATAFRNARDLAKRYRDTFILDANARASQPAVGTRKRDPVDGADYLASRDADEALQRHIADTTHHTSEDDDEESAVPQYPSPITKRHRESPSPPSTSKRTFSCARKAAC